ncbi:DUF6585 family protein [Kribbella sp. NPDC058245]|uniref:DUF6585 family protein n=1 Tax=Kribbella sp. NPDC058245 TaxID=3346399 RepID=UPI0036E5812A
MSDQISAAVAQARLGEHQATHQPREHTSGFVVSSLMAVLFGVFGFGSLFAGGPAYLSIIFTPVSIAAAWWAVKMGRKAANKGKVQLDLFEHGMTFIDHRGKLSAFRWDSMQVKQTILKQKADFGMVSSTSFSYKVYGDDGAEAMIEGSHEGNAAVDAWGPAIQQAVTKAQLPRLLALFRQGETLRFGTLTLRWDSLAAKDKVWAWDQLEGAWAANGSIYLREHGARRNHMLSEISRIPNFYIFSTLLDLRLDAERE